MALRCSLAYGIPSGHAVPTYTAFHGDPHALCRGASAVHRVWGRCLLKRVVVIGPSRRKSLHAPAVGKTGMLEAGGRCPGICNDFPAGTRNLHL